MLGDDIADVLSSGGVGTVATNIFVGQMPDNVDTGLSVIETGGAFPLRTMGAGASAIGAPTAPVELPRVQVLSRSPIYATARAKAQDAFNLLDGIAARTINGVRYLYITAVQSPMDLGRDKNNRAHFSVNFDVVKAVSTSSST